jgi:dienelactone hydrolase
MDYACFRTAAYVAVIVSLSAPGRGQAADAIDLPEPTGPFAVGTFTHEWHDLERPDDFTLEREYLAAAFTVWYPAAPGSADGKRAAYDPLHDELLAALEADQDLAIWVPRLAPIGRLAAHSIEGVPIDTQQERHPVVLVSPGGNVSRRAHTALCEDLASHGYVVCAISHPYSGLDLIADELHASHECWESIDGDDEESRRADDALSDHLAMDASRALDRLTELSSRAGHLLDDRIDTSRVAILGHSRGGSTVGRACTRDARFRAAIVLDNIGPDHERDHGLNQPHLAIRTDEARRWDSFGIQNLTGYLSRNRVAGYEAVIQGAVHMSFTDIPFAAPPSTSGKLATARVHELTSALVRAFLARHLDGAEGAQLVEIAEGADEVKLTVFVAQQDE